MFAAQLQSMFLISQCIIIETTNWSLLGYLDLDLNSGLRQLDHTTLHQNERMNILECNRKH